MAWVDELHLVSGKLAATPMKKADPVTGKRPERDKRPKPVAVGNTVSFARRVLGEVQIHYFFASRIRLPNDQIEELQKNIGDWAMPIYFEEKEPNVVGVLTYGGSKILGTIAFVSGLIDAVIATKDTYVSYKDGEMGAAAGNFLTAAGSLTSALGGLIVLFGGGLVVGLVGLAIVGVGVLVKILFTKSDMRKFLEHTVWGTEYGHSTSSLPSWADTPFAQWDGDYDAQFRAALRMLCSFDISVKDDRAGKLEMKWVPDDAWIELHYTETWPDKSSNDRDFRVWAKLSANDPPHLTSSDLTMVHHGKNDYIVRPNPKKVSSDPTTTSELDTSSADYGVNEYTVTHAKVKLEAKLILMLEEELAIPATGYVAEALT